MISSLNHHISILKLTVHEAYLDFLASGCLPDPLPQQKDWCKPKLARSEWLDLFDVKERVLAFRGIWGVMEYLSRPQEVAREVEMEQKAGADVSMNGT